MRFGYWDMNRSNGIGNRIGIVRVRAGVNNDRIVRSPRVVNRGNDGPLVIMLNEVDFDSRVANAADDKFIHFR